MLPNSLEVLMCTPILSLHTFIIHILFQTERKPSVQYSINWLCIHITRLFIDNENKQVETSHILSYFFPLMEAFCVFFIVAVQFFVPFAKCCRSWLVHCHNFHLVTTNCAATSKQIRKDCGIVHLKHLVFLSPHSACILSASYECKPLDNSER